MQITRRQFLATFAALALAGCAGGGGGTASARKWHRVMVKGNVSFELPEGWELTNAPEFDMQGLTTYVGSTDELVIMVDVSDFESDHGFGDVEMTTVDGAHVYSRKVDDSEGHSFSVTFNYGGRSYQIMLASKDDPDLCSEVGERIVSTLAMG